jgi:hypothetical protein
LQRFNGVNFSALNHYFSKLSKVITKERYSLDAIFNIDETGFSLGSIRDVVVLINKAYKTKGKRQASKQEWIIAIVYLCRGGDPAADYNFQRPKS